MGEHLLHHCRGQWAHIVVLPVSYGPPEILVFDSHEVLRLDRREIVR
jgi:hypothetical protein